MEKERELTCRDCEYCVLTGFFDPLKMCEKMGWPVNENGPACISIKPKLQNGRI